MTKLYLNTSNEFTINSYSRYTSVNGDTVTSNASVSFPDTSDYDDLAALMETEITDLQIKIDGTSVYHLTNTSGRITSINEYLESETVYMNAQIMFGEGENNEL